MSLDTTLQALRSGAAGTGIFMDFDGTLAPIVADPAAARIAPGGAETLAQLAARYKVVAMISGRAATDLHARVGAAGPRYFGLYGAEEMRDGELLQASDAPQWREGARWLAAEAAEFIRSRGLVGCEVDFKDLAVSVHYRKRPGSAPPAELHEWAKKSCAQVEFRVGIGRQVLELKPLAVSKAGAFQRLVADHRIGSAVVAGDDSADVEMMEAAGRLIGGTLLRVGIASGESPPGMGAHTDLVLDSPEELVELLGRLL